MELPITIKEALIIFQEIITRSFFRSPFKKEQNTVFGSLAIFTIGLSSLGFLGNYKNFCDSYPEIACYLTFKNLSILFLILLVVEFIYFAAKISIEKKNNIYKYLNFTKHVTVFSDRHGIVQGIGEIKILKDKEFTDIDYWFELGKSSMEGLKFDIDLKQMEKDLKKSPKTRFSKQTFAGRLFSINGKEVPSNQRKLEIIPTEQQLKKKFFDIKFAKSVTILKNSVLKFGWVWTSENLFPTTKKHKENCVEKTKYIESEIKINSETDFLKFIISFEEGIEIDESNPPTLHKKIKGGTEKKIDILKKENDMYYVRYKIDIPHPKIGDKYIVRWDYT